MTRGTTMRGPLGVVAATVLALTCGALTSCEPEEIDGGGGNGGGGGPSQEQQQEQAAVEPPTKEPEAAEFSIVPADESGDASSAQSGDEPLWGCTLNWMLDWPMETTTEPTVEATYGMNLSCEWPEIGGPTIDSDLQVDLKEEGGGTIDEAPMVTGGWDTDDYLESSDTVEVAYPRQLWMSSHLVMQLIPGCGIDGCGDPDPGFVWGAMPPECLGTGTWIAVCDYEWRDINIGNAACDDAPSYNEESSSVRYQVTCDGGTATVTAQITNADDGKCTYAHAYFYGGRWEWAGRCEPGSGSVTLGTGRGPVVHIVPMTREPSTQ
ncbi:hypothetical protein [Streptomyces sp. 6N223]|uniref:hypothetical protein n=1 Tax=Streptomyces sp. 6N223 TaxID=3457412 RepID=UPI003FD1F3DE